VCRNIVFGHIGGVGDEDRPGRKTTRLGQRISRPHGAVQGFGASAAAAAGAAGAAALGLRTART